MTAVSLGAQQLRAVLSLIWATVGLIWNTALIVWCVFAAHHYDKLPNAQHFQTLVIVLLLLCWNSASDRRKSV